ncbi:MAG: hypothetical protein V2I33_24090 [Kangiellaceae bacterium]|jgi:hypothetical protein|nr:hypothetical protein [Kangiellaceae bacterium]
MDDFLEYEPERSLDTSVTLTYSDLPVDNDTIFDQMPFNRRVTELLGTPRHRGDDFDASF